MAKLHILDEDNIRIFTENNNTILTMTRKVFNVIKKQIDEKLDSIDELDINGKHIFEVELKGTKIKFIKYGMVC